MDVHGDAHGYGEDVVLSMCLERFDLDARVISPSSVPSVLHLFWARKSERYASVVCQ